VVRAVLARAGRKACSLVSDQCRFTRSRSLNSKNIGDEGATALAEALKEKATVTTLE